MTIKAINVRNQFKGTIKEIVEGDVAMVDQATYLCLRREGETWYLPWTAIKCVKGPALPDRGITGGYPRTQP